MRAQFYRRFFFRIKVRSLTRRHPKRFRLPVPHAWTETAPLVRRGWKQKTFSLNFETQRTFLWCRCLLICISESQSTPLYCHRLFICSSFRTSPSTWSENSRWRTSSSIKRRRTSRRGVGRPTGFRRRRKRTLARWTYTPSSSSMDLRQRCARLPQRAFLIYLPFGRRSC